MYTTTLYRIKDVWCYICGLLYTCERFWTSAYVYSVRTAYVASHCGTRPLLSAFGIDCIMRDVV